MRVFDNAWNALSQPQKNFLKLWHESGGSIRRVLKTLNLDDHSAVRWRRGSPDFALCEHILKAGITKEILQKERLTIRQDEIVEAGLAEVPILHQGLDTGFKQHADLGVALRGNETLLRQGGHLKDEQPGAIGRGPMLSVEITNIQGEVVQRREFGTVVELPSPTDWIDE